MMRHRLTNKVDNTGMEQPKRKERETYMNYICLSEVVTIHFGKNKNLISFHIQEWC